MTRIVVALSLLVLAFAPPALAGGFATVQLTSLPEGTEAGGTWQAHLLVLRHGRTPLDGLAPVIRIRDAGGKVAEFPALPAGEPGRYDAEVKFPAAGTWRWEIWDGYSQTHTYSPVTIGAGSGGDRSVPAALPVGVGAVALALVGAAVLLVRRRRARPRPALG
jgi:hypothetical protein